MTDPKLLTAEQVLAGAEAALAQSEARCAAMRAALMSARSAIGASDRFKTGREFWDWAAWAVKEIDTALATDAGREWLEVADRQHRHTVEFRKGSRLLGTLFFEDDGMRFESDADASAKVFFDFVDSYWRARERQP